MKLEYRNIGKGGEPDVRIYCDQSVGNENLRSMMFIDPIIADCVRA